MALGRKDRRGVHFVHPERWHVTLRFLGECDPGAATTALDAAVLPAARARLGPAVDVMFDRVLVVPVAGVDELAAAVSAATADLGEPPRRRFTGHLSLARIDRRNRGRLPDTVGAMVDACVRRRGGRARPEPARPPRRPLRDAGLVAGDRGAVGTPAERPPAGRRWRRPRRPARPRTRTSDPSGTSISSPSANAAARRRPVSSVKLRSSVPHTMRAGAVTSRERAARRSPSASRSTPGRSGRCRPGCGDRSSPA